MSPRFWIIVGALAGALGVGLGAFGAHGLPPWLRQHVAAEMRSAEDSIPVEREVEKRVATYETAVRYQMYHALGIVLAGVLLACRGCRLWQAAACAMLFGILVFSGLLYALVVTGVKVLGAIVPIGGVAMIVGWVLLAAGAWSMPDLRRQ
ncbi:MAG: DUF423 domain-containing protein [Pirellulales bacterium]|nr:DUF423 domain-containing protein [Pirellulales bacterium]